MGENGAANYQDGDEWGLTINHHTRLLSRSGSISWEGRSDQEHLPMPGTVLGVLHIVVGGVVRMTPKILPLV